MTMPPGQPGFGGGPHHGPPPGAGANHPTQQFPTGPAGFGPTTHGGPGGPIGPGGPGPQGPPRPKVFSAIWTLGLISVAAVALGLSLDENGDNAWHVVHAWGGLALAGAVLAITPAVARSLNLTPHRAWQVAACGAAALLLFWVLFVLPNVGTNTSLLTTVGIAAGVIAVWIAPGRDQLPDPRLPHQHPSQSNPSQHTW